jgi:hypothetical protein
VGGGGEGVADDEKGYVVFVCALEDFVGGGFDEFAVGDDDFAAIVGFLLPIGGSGG